MERLPVFIILGIVIGGGISIAVIAIVLAILKAINDEPTPTHTQSGSTGFADLFSTWFTPEYERVGKQGERYAAELIQSVFREGDLLLKSRADIDRAIHTADRKMLSPKTIEAITKLLS